jgi:hypothetical protein
MLNNTCRVEINKGNILRKLHKLTEWLTLEDAANDISNVLDEPVTLANIYKLSLDGHLKLSANFVNHAKAKKIRFIKTEDVKYKKRILRLPKGPQQVGSFKIPEIDPQKVLSCMVPVNVEYQISKDYWVEKVEPKLFSIEGLWDLTMRGNERLDIEHLYHQEISGVAVKDQPSNGVYLQRGNIFCELHVSLGIKPQADVNNSHEKCNDEGECESDRVINVNNMRPRRPRVEQSYRASRLDEQESVLVVKTDEITRFIQSLEDTPQEVKAPAQKADTKNIDKRVQSKANTQAKYLAWQKQAIKLKKEHPNKSKVWISKQIANLSIAQDKDSETIRRNMKI